MGEIRVSAERDVAAPAEVVRELLTDYARRPRFLTENYTDFGVDEGGAGAGTAFHYTFRAGRRVRGYRMRVEETPDGALVERDTGSSLVTTWRVTPAGPGSRVRVETSWTGGSGVGGFFERTFAPGALRRVYEQVLARLAQAAGR